MRHRALKRRYGHTGGGADVYAQLKALGLKEGRGADCQLDHHESDLYVLDTPAARKILKDAGRSFSAFRNQIDHKTWLDVPFAYTPFWEGKARR